jgi:competence protein ComEC
MPERGRARDRTGGHAGTWPQREVVAAATPSFGLRFSFADKLKAWLRAEAGAGRLLPWVPIAFGAGIALYFTADHEPVAWVAAATATALCVAALLLRRHRLFAAVVLIAAMAAGFAVATLKTARVSHVVLTRPVYVPVLKGFVETREVRERTDRFVLRVVEMDDPWRHIKLARVRLSVRKDTAPAVGSFVELKARLQPPLAPMRPGSYDFGRDMYFQGIGASGFVMGAIKVLTPPNSGGLALRYATLMQDFRDAIDARIRLVLSGDSRAIATALLTGRRDAITTPVNDALFISGLGHVLSISGYHMAVVAGVVFFAIRALLALIPALTATFPIKKWSAAGALAAAAFYLLLSGAEVATQRSFFMTAVVLIAVMVDRRAITFRTLAVAAMIVLTIAPQALVHPSFQMSFAATLGLVALVQIGMPKLFASPDHSPTARAALWGGREIVTLALASLVAGLATTPYAAFHFHRVTPYGVIANLLAMPVVSALVMPAGLLGLLAMPFGFDGVFWHLMDFGIEWMIAVSQWVAALPGAIGRMAAFGTGPLIAATVGIVLLGLLRTPLRWTGAAAIGLAIAWSLAVKQPDILIAADGHAVGVRGQDGRLHLMRTAKDTFMIKEWLAADADGRQPVDPTLAEGVSCDEAGCVVRMAGGEVVALAQRPEALEDDCMRAAVIVTPWQAPQGCQAEVIDSDRLRREGALALRRTQGSGNGAGHNFAISAIRPRGVDRPWFPAADDGRSPRSASRRAPAHPVDATPAASDLRPDD